MDTLNEYSYMWKEEKDKYVLVCDETGTGIIFINGKELMFELIEDDELYNSIIAKMTENGNKVYQNIIELQKAIGII